MAYNNWLFRRLGLGLGLMGVACLAAALGLLAALKQLPYSSVVLTGIDGHQALRDPSPDFSMGRFTWPVRTLSTTSKLQPFRDAMPMACREAKGLDAAACVSRDLAARTPVGDPATEFAAADFDPAAHLEQHLAGAPGHCLTRSAILAGELLATGTPARVVQLVPVDGKGHTLVEVWDDERGWIVVDPSTGGFLTGRPRHASAVELLAEPARAGWTSFSESPNAAEAERLRVHFSGLLTGNVLYPEPWLYLRVGERVAPRPWRGAYARVGPAFLTHGPAQRALTWGAATSTLVGLGLLGAVWRLRRMAPPRDSRARAPEQVEGLSHLDAFPET